MGDSKEILYKIEQITKVFGGNYVLNDISFNINKGEIFGIIGASGSGKTTLLNTLVGFIKPDRGVVKYRDLRILNSVDPSAFRSVHKYQKELKRIYGFAAQSPSFYPNLTVLENLYYFGSLYNLPNDTIRVNVDNLLHLVSLTQSQHILARKLSGGMQRRLDIACSLIHDPKILFLDEPTADLDPVLSNKIWNLLRIVNQRGTTIILASHHIAELEHLCTRVAIIKDNRIVALGKPDELKDKDPALEYICLESYPGDYKKIIAQLKKAKIGHIHNNEVKDKTLIIHTTRPSVVIHKLIKVIEDLKENITNVEFVKPTLDEVFIKINKESDTTEKKKKKKNHKKKHHNKKKHKKFKHKK